MPNSASPTLTSGASRKPVDSNGECGFALSRPDPPNSREWRLWTLDAHATARRVTKNSDLAGDLAQEALLRLMRCYASVRNLHNWLFVILRQLAGQAALDAGEPVAGPRRFDPAVVAVKDIDQSLDLERGLRCLRPRQARLLALTLEGYSHSEIASRIGCATHQVGPRLARAQRALGRRLGSRSTLSSLWSGKTHRSSPSIHPEEEPEAIDRRVPQK